MKFKTFIVEEQELTEGIKEDIIVILGKMNSDELNEFGEWIYDELFSDEEYSEGDEHFHIEEILELLGTLSSSDLDYVFYMLSDEDDFDTEAHGENDVNIGESISRIMKAKNKVKSKKLFMKTKAEFRKDKAERKKQNRLTRVDRKKKYLSNKVKIKSYAKSYSTALKSGKHRKKIRV